MDLPSIYITYSIANISTVLRAKDSGYTVNPINSTYPVHNATLYFNGLPYYNSSKSFTCAITGVDMEFLQQYDVSNENLTYYTTIHISTSKEKPPEKSMHESSSSNLAAGFVVGIVIGAILILAVIIIFISFCYYIKHRQPSKRRKLSIKTPFGQLTAESAIDSKIINEKVQFPRDKITLLHMLGKLF